MGQAKGQSPEASVRAGREVAQPDVEQEGALDSTWARASQVATIGLFIIAVLWVAQVTQPVLLPVLLAWVIATIVQPVIELLHRHKIPRAVAALLATFVLVAIIVFLLVLLSTPLAYWVGRASELGLLIKQKLQSVSQPLALFEDLRKSLGSVTGGDTGTIVKIEDSSTSVVTSILSILTPAVSQFILFVVALMFQLVYQKKMYETAVMLLRDRSARLTALRVLSDIDDNMSTYFSTFTVVNVALALVTILLTWAVGLPNPLLWGVLAGVMNYVPYLGPAIVTATLAVVSLLTFPTLAEAAVAPLAYIILITIEGHFLTPALMGRRLELNPFAVFLAIAFSTWLWGPIGAFLAVPLLMALSVTLAHVFGEEKPALPD